ncbi:MAG: hypothetical protein ACRDIB_03635, partial [Ardenticatenaceae bacterium]
VLAPGHPKGQIRYLLSLKLVDAAGRVWGERVSEPCNAWCPTHQWEPGSTITDHHALMVPADTPPGTYTVQLSWLDLASGQPLPLADGIGDSVVTLLDVTVAESSLQTPVQPPPVPLDVHFSNDLRLRGVDVPGEPLSVGASLSLALLWQAPPEGSLPASLTASVEAWGEGAEPIARWELPLVAEAYPPSQWTPNRYVRGRFGLDVPTALAPGRYRLTLRLLDATGRSISFERAGSSLLLEILGDLLRSPDDERIRLADLRVGDRPRSFDLPPLATPLEIEWVQGVTLRGAEWAAGARPGETAPVMLVWQAGGATERPYKVFLHLRDASGRTVTQDDTVPAHGAAPTTSWAAGEVVVDEHTLTLPPDLAPGNYTLFVGLYHEASDERLPLNTGAADAYRLGVLEIR